MNGSFNIRTRQGGSGRVGHTCGDRRYDVKGCRNINHVLGGQACETRGRTLPSVSIPRMALPPSPMLL
eukprot:3397114-Prymnesium_polylepis.1